MTKVDWDLQLPVQSVPITAKVVSSNPADDEVYFIQHYGIKFATGRWFSLGTPVSSTNKTDRHDITEILLKKALHQPTINQSIYFCLFISCFVLLPLFYSHPPV
jgi:hypothetical protein